MHYESFYNLIGYKSYDFFKLKNGKILTVVGGFLKAARKYATFDCTSSLLMPAQWGS